MTDPTVLEDGTLRITLTDDFAGGSTFMVSVAAMVLKEEFGQEQGRAISEKIVNRAEAEARKFVSEVKATAE